MQFIEIVTVTVSSVLGLPVRWVVIILIRQTLAAAATVSIATLVEAVNLATATA